jgi:protein-S-isoprenylcysteine O-methyltransferase Ste14
MKITMLWKFLYWPVVWILVFIPGLIWPVALEDIWLTLSRILGVILLLYALFLSSSGGRVLARFAHRDEHETFWPDRFTEFGFFSCMRHPMHMGLALFPVALALLLGRVLPIVGSGWGVAAAFWFVLQIEEKDALEKFGDVYVDYMLRVPPFSIDPKCLREGFKIWKG